MLLPVNVISKKLVTIQLDRRHRTDGRATHARCALLTPETIQTMSLFPVVLRAHPRIRRGWDYPLHLGVTEAGEGEDGRMKSAIGIGALLTDGLGDTIRVSLTEDPEYELSPCGELAEVHIVFPTRHERMPSILITVDYLEAIVLMCCRQAVDR